MTRQVVTCLAEDDFQKALEAMSEHQVRRIPIVNNKNKILGMLSQADVAMRYDHPKRTMAMVKNISQP